MEYEGLSNAVQTFHAAVVHAGPAGNNMELAQRLLELLQRIRKLALDEEANGLLHLLKPHLNLLAVVQTVSLPVPVDWPMLHQHGGLWGPP